MSMMMTTRWRLILLCLAAAIALALPAAVARAQDEREPVRVDGRTIFTVGPAPDADARTRADRIENRLQALLDNPESITPATIIGSGAQERAITVSGATIVTVYPVDAEDNLTTMDRLAVDWVNLIDQTLQEGVERRRAGGGTVRVLIESGLASLVESVQTVLPSFLAALLVILAFGLLAGLVKRLLDRLLPHLRGNVTTKNLIGQMIYYTIWILGIVVAVSAMGFDPQALATAIGLTSVALGFALKDVLSNFISGLLLLVMRPFHLGDQIIVGDTEGAVEGIELRATRIRTYDGRVVLVPNAEIFTSRLTNNTASPLRRGSVVVRLSYDADLRRAAQVMLDAARASAGVLEEPPPSILLSELEPTVVAVEVRFWTDSRRSDFLAARSRVSEAVVGQLRDAGIPLPDPAAVKIITNDE